MVLHGQLEATRLDCLSLARLSLRPPLPSDRRRLRVLHPLGSEGMVTPCGQFSNCGGSPPPTPHPARELACSEVNWGLFFTTAPPTGHVRGCRVGASFLGQPLMSRGRGRGRGHSWFRQACTWWRPSRRPCGSPALCVALCHHEAASDSFPAAEIGLIQWAAELAFPQASGLKLLPGSATGWLCTISIHFPSWSSGSLPSLDPFCALCEGSSWSLNVYPAPAT